MLPLVALWLAFRVPPCVVMATAPYEHTGTLSPCFPLIAPLSRFVVCFDDSPMDAPDSSGIGDLPQHPSEHPSEHPVRNPRGNCWGGVGRIGRRVGRAVAMATGPLCSGHPFFLRRSFTPIDCAPSHHPLPPSHPLPSSFFKCSTRMLQGCFRDALMGIKGETRVNNRF